MGFRNNPEARREENGIVYFVRDTLSIGDKAYERLAVQTHFVQRGESYIDLLDRYVKPLYKSGDILSMGEKVISMCQNNIVEKKDVKVGFWARFLSKFASSNNHGIAMDEPYKLQLAINLAGLWRILWASFCSAITKLLGKKGVFYKIAGHGIDGIDGFYMGSSFELYHDIAILNPKEPVKVCNEIKEKLDIDCMIVDANDLSIEVFGKSDSISDIPNENLISMIRDNPAGQSDELTPLILIREKTESADETEQAADSVSPEETDTVEAYAAEAVDTKAILADKQG